jgi:hypothetical protein
MTLPRFRLRTLMVVVAVIALLLAGEVTRQRLTRISSEYRAKADEWSQKAQAAYLSVEPEWQFPLWYRRSTPMVEYANAMVEKYEFAADHPWRPVAPDPPEPE